MVTNKRNVYDSLIFLGTYCQMISSSDVDKTTLLLPHFKRFEILDAEGYIKEAHPGVIEEISAVAETKRFGVVEGISYMTTFLIASKRLLNNPGGYILYQALMTYYCYREREGVHMILRDSVCELLSDFMELSEGISCRQLMSPYPMTFLSFGETLEARNLYLHESGKTRSFEGCYLTDESFECKGTSDLRSHLGIKEGDMMRVITAVFVAPPITKDGEKFSVALDDRFHIISIYIKDEDQDLMEVFQQHLDFFQSQGMPDEDYGLQSYLLEFLTKALLYINSKDVRKETKNNAQYLQKKLKGLTNKSKIRQAERRLIRETDHILIGEESYEAIQMINGAGTEDMSGRKKRPHYRRGHSRTYHRGEITEFIRTIMPMLIGVRTGKDAKEVKKKSYKVR